MLTDNMYRKEWATIVDEYNKYTSNEQNQRAARRKEIQKCFEDIMREGEENTTILDSILQNLKQYSDQTQKANNFKMFKEELDKIKKVRQEALDEALKLKGEQRAEIASINKEAEQISDEIRQLSEDNERITEILKSETDNIVCRLMKGAGQ